MTVLFWIYVFFTIIVFLAAVVIFIAGYGGLMEESPGSQQAEEYLRAMKILAIIAISALLLVWPVMLVVLMLYIAFRKRSDIS